MKLIEFVGLPRAGKLTLMRALVRELSLLDYKVQSIQLDKSIPAAFIQRERFFDRQMKVLMSTIAEIIEAQDSSRADVVFIHRGPWDGKAFFEGLIKGGFISRKEAKSGIALAKGNTNRIDFVVLVKISSKISLERNLDLGLPNLVSDKNFLESLSRVYQSLENRLPREKSLVIDGSRPVKENLEVLLEAILPFLKTELPGFNNCVLCPKKEGKLWQLLPNV